jgi:Bacterial Ig-like domain (group 3)/IPT/TIG domain
VISVSIGGVAATNITVINSTTITVITPAHAAGLFDVAITTPGGTVTMPSLFTYLTPAPTVANISPTSGTTLGGTVVTITGANFTAATAVAIGGVAASNMTILNANTIVAVTGARAAGTVDVAITNATGTNAGPGLYTYIQQGSTTVAVSSANPSSYGQLVTFTATVGGGGSGTPTGTITFKDGTTTLGTSTLDGTGKATFTISSLNMGSHSITAAYGGNGTYSASTSAAIAQVVGCTAR